MTNTPLRGLLASDADGEVRINVPGGTWVIQRADIERQSDWANPTVAASAAGDAGTPVEVVVRPGASIGWLQTLTIELLVRPMTLPDRYRNVVGSEDLSRQSEEWGRTHGFAFDRVVVAEAGHTSVSCWDHPSGFGTVCQGDDCQ